MTSIQIITFGNTNQSKYKGLGAQVSTFVEYSALDDFDINVIDSSSKPFWEGWLEMCSSRGGIYQPFGGFSYGYIQDSNLKQICDVIENCKTTTIFVTPLNIDVKIDGKNNKLSTLNETIGDFFGGFIFRNPIGLLVEKTTTKIDKQQYNAFLHLPNYMPINQSEKSKKTTTANIYDKKYVTTLDIFESVDHFQAFVLQFIKPKETTPEWFDELQYFDDKTQKEAIAANEETIRKANEVIGAAKIKMEDNNRFKSILYSNGDELVKVVHEILGDLMDGDLNSFVDEHKEDFCMKKDGLTFLGEIKGTTSNVNNSNISQLTNHCDLYKEKCEEEGRTEEIRRLLIMNHQRTKAPKEREPVHSTQIEKAERDECLIIETPTLLKLYEMFKNGKCRLEDCIKLFSEKTGLLTVDTVEKILGKFIRGGE